MKVKETKRISAGAMFIYGTKLKAQRLLNQTSAACLVFFTVNKWKSTVINKKKCKIYSL